VYYPFDKFGYDDMNMIVHPQECHVVARLTRDGLWRVAYQEDKNMTFEEIIDNQPAHYQRILPGNPKVGEYTLSNLNPYRMHQRCAEKFRVGRICLVADAAHLCNPWGGLGLTGGFADATGLVECLEGIATGRADHSILDKYDEVRRSIYHKVIDPISTGNYHRVSTVDPDTALEDDPFLSMCAAAKNDSKLKEKIEKVFSTLGIVVLLC
jgi:2-polyprenyl-6-methoxyphenol hydroxylase-like FAD-dependent oxidoreductase